MNILTKTVVAGVIGSLALAAAVPAEAHGRYRDGGDDAAIAVGAGILGLAVGAAITSDRPYYYDEYYNTPTYYPAYPAYGYYNNYPVYRGYRQYYNGYNGYRGYNGHRGYNSYRGYNGYRDYDRGYRHEGHRGHW